MEIYNIDKNAPSLSVFSTLFFASTSSLGLFVSYWFVFMFDIASTRRSSIRIYFCSIEGKFLLLSCK